MVLTEKELDRRMKGWIAEEKILRRGGRDPVCVYGQDGPPGGCGKASCGHLPVPWHGNGRENHPSEEKPRKPRQF